MNNNNWIDVNHCRLCGGPINYDRGFVLTSSPPQYQGRCQDCGDLTNRLCSEVNQNTTKAKG